MEINKDYKIFYIIQNDINKCVTKILSNTSSSLKLTIISNLNDDDNLSAAIAEILYICYMCESSNMINDLYHFVNLEKWKYMSVCKTVEHSVIYNYTLRLKELLLELNIIKEKQLLREYLECYNDYGIYEDNFFIITNYIYEKLIFIISKVIIQTKEDFLKEGVRSDVSKYFDFHTSFFRS